MPTPQRTSPSTYQLKQVYAHLYGRSDLRGSALGFKLAVSLVSLWLLCGVLNYVVFGRDLAPPRDRVALAFGYGPAFLPLGLTQPRSAVSLLGKPIPVRQGAHLIGGSVLLLCVLPFVLAGDESRHRARWQRQARQHAAGQGRLPLCKQRDSSGSTVRAYR